MARTIRTGIDALSGYRQLAWENDRPPLPPGEDHTEIAYSITLANGMTFDRVTIWGIGLVSLGPATAAQQAFVAAMTPTTSLASFPGLFAAGGVAIPAQVSVFDILVGNPASTDLRIWWSGGGVILTDQGFGASGATGQTGVLSANGYQAGAGFSYWSDFSITQGTASGELMVGTDLAETLMGLAGDDTLVGGLGADALRGGDGNDVLVGAGKDRMWGDAGNDWLKATPDFALADGGSGYDRLTVDYSASNRSLVLLFDNLLADTRVSGIEQLEVIGTNQVDTITGTAGDDRLFGGGGYDVLRGGAGNDWLDAGPAGPSTVGIIGERGGFYSGLSLDSLWSAGAGGPTLTTRVTYVPVLLPPAPNTGGDFSFTVTDPGTTLSIAYAFQGALAGGWGYYDAHLVAPDGSWIDLHPYSADNVVSLTQVGTYQLSASLFSGSSWEYGHLDLTVTLSGGEVLSANRLIGGAGNDTYVIYSVTDQIVEGAGEGIDTVRSPFSYVLGDNLEQLVLTGSAVDGTGNGLANAIIGNVGDNWLRGLGGNDRLEGGDGTDRLTGGSGRDIFVVGLDELGTSRSGEHDTITDFIGGQDRIDLSALYAGSKFGGVKKGTSGDFADISKYRVATIVDGDRTWVIGDTDGLPGADFVLELTGAHNLTKSDFIL
ncbi:M10 family metallopeptidase C-terminal domain-containing protein [Sphingomonas sp. BN140010]|uniref:M10 family metallopeptidase C-terminal domain-containing protein n=1 Tax=Sphingomonas arvum TaxID=2992113 RepID=A0ABT3JHA2_9SPHN|nr:calcium-binding protein [Sphingomonas sp. BN140010]MCW3798458.1 M10 family metallopeptidase C-terminal domain-containing protein [Sphingomonas sp. BN140010]